MPYPGLRPFDISADRDESVIFFGRKKQVYELIDRLATSQFIAVLGPSGCGKSSLIRAGVIPNLEKGYLDRAGARWTSIVMEPGGHPVRALATGLHNAIVEAASGGTIPDRFTTDEIEQRLNRRPDALVTLFEEQETVSAFDPDSNILILVDQFEELFRKDMTAEPEAQQFINLMLNVYHDPPQRLYIILTMRTDFIKQSACYPGLPTVLSRTMCLLDKIDKMGLREAITEPVKLKHYNGEISEDLTQWILGQMDTECPYDPDLLPLMQHALLWGWQQALHKAQPYTEEKTVLRLEDLSAFTDLAECLSKHADAIFDSLTAEQQRIAEVMFRLLCDASSDGTKIRRVTSEDEIAAVSECLNPEDVRKVVDAFMSDDARFIRWKDEGKMLDISHESFIRKWDRFKDWADREVKKVKKYIELCSLAHRPGLLDRLKLVYYSEWDNNIEPTAAWWEARSRFKHKDDMESVTPFSDVKTYLKECEIACQIEEENKIKFEKNEANLKKIKKWGVRILFGLLLVGGVIKYSHDQSKEADIHFNIAADLIIGKFYANAIEETQIALGIYTKFPVSCLIEIKKNCFGIGNRLTECYLVRAKACLSLGRIAITRANEDFSLAKSEDLLSQYKQFILDSFNKVISREPKYHGAYSILSDLIELYLDSKVADKEKKAMEFYNILKDNGITDTSLLADIGDLFSSKRFNKEALEICIYADSIDSGKDIGTLMKLGALYCQTENYTKAIEKLKEAQKMVHNNPIVQIRLSEVYIKRNDSNDRENALACLEKVKDDPNACPNLINEYFKAAQECLSKGDTASAYEHLFKIKDLLCLAYEPEYYARKGALLMAIQEPKALDYAIISFLEAIEIQEQIGKTDPETYFMLASAYAQKEEYYKAIDSYRKAVNINKSDFRANRGLAFCLKKIGKDKEAEEKLNESENIEPWKPLVSDTLERKISTHR